MSVSACARSGKGPGTDASWRRRATMARLVSPRVWGGGLVTAACLKLTVDEARWPRVAALRARAKDWTRYWARAHLRFYCLVQPPFSHTSRMPGRVLSAIYPSPGLRIGSRSARPQRASLRLSKSSPARLPPVSRPLPGPRSHGPPGSGGAQGTEPTIRGVSTQTAAAERVVKEGGGLQLEAAEAAPVSAGGRESSTHDKVVDFARKCACVAVGCEFLESGLPASTTC